MMLNSQQRKERNAYHLQHPESGDYWDERFLPILLVLDVEGDIVTICDTILDLGHVGWKWDMAKARKVPREYLRERLSNGNNVPGTWADVTPKRMMYQIAAWKLNGRKVTSEPPPSPETTHDVVMKEKIRQMVTGWGAKHKIYLMAPQWRDLTERIFTLFKE